MFLYTLFICIHLFYSSYPGHVESINCVAFTPDAEYFATGCTAGQLKLWKASPPCTVCQIFLENVHDLGIMSCDFSSCYTEKQGIACTVNPTFRSNLIVSSFIVKLKYVRVLLVNTVNSKLSAGGLSTLRIIHGLRGQ